MEKCVRWLIFAETLRNTAMKEEDIYKIYAGTSDEIIKEGYEGTKLEKKRQRERFDRLDSKATTLVERMAVVALALTGTLYMYMNSASPSLWPLLAMAIVLAATVVSGCILIFGVLSGRSFISDGINPDLYYNNEVVEWCSECDKNKRTSLFRLYRTLVLKKEISLNEAELQRMAKRHRWSIRIWCAGGGLGIVICILWGLSSAV